jgi:hypothetical protein
VVELDADGTARVVQRQRLVQSAVPILRSSSSRNAWRAK